MNLALWNPSWGGFLEKVNQVTKDGATLSDSAREETRIFHRDFVRGRGPFPALRIGSQPYGTLPVSSVERRWRGDRGDTFEAGLLPLLERLRTRWRQSVAKLSRIGDGGPIDETVKEMLASSPVSVALRVRSVISSEFAQIAPEVTDADPDDLAVERLINELLLQELGILSFVASHGFVRRKPSPRSAPGARERSGGDRRPAQRKIAWSEKCFAALLELSFIALGMRSKTTAGAGGSPKS